MTKREEFAKAAMQGLLLAILTKYDHPTWTPDALAGVAVEFADKTLKKLGEPNPTPIK